jgi:citrate lyase subunit beta/citryl-CoA lyase
VPIVNEEFTPPATEVASARKIISEFYKAEKAGRASLEVDGKMVDYPVVYRAENLIKIADNVAKKEAAMRA